jgi:hypothetical protein
MLYISKYMMNPFVVNSCIDILLQEFVSETLVMSDPDWLMYVCLPKSQSPIFVVQELASGRAVDRVMWLLILQLATVNVA